MLRTVLVIALLAALLFLGALQLPRLRGIYVLQDADHDALMTSAASAVTTRTVDILFVGNSLTYVNDLPAMLVNIATTDPANSTRLAVKAVTYPGATLNFMLTKTGALAWARQHHCDYVVLQERSGWYESPQGIAAARTDVADWKAALAPLNETPILFEVWADGPGSADYSTRGFPAFGKTPAQDARDTAERTALLGMESGLPIVAVGQAFARAARMPAAPDLFGPDHHHPSVAGSYLAALTFYQYFTGRSGAQAAYRPWGISAADAALLLRASLN